MFNRQKEMQHRERERERERDLKHILASIMKAIIMGQQHLNDKRGNKDVGEKTH